MGRKQKRASFAFHNREQQIREQQIREQQIREQQSRALQYSAIKAVVSPHPALAREGNGNHGQDSDG
jgi:hypothetical protein